MIAHQSPKDPTPFLQTCYLGTEGIRNFGKSRSDSQNVSPWASPMVVVPKRTAPGEPPKRRLCVDYRAVNSLLPPVKKAFSKAKGVLTLVPLLKN